MQNLISRFNCVDACFDNSQTDMSSFETRRKTGFPFRKTDCIAHILHPAMEKPLTKGSIDVWNS